MTNEANEVLKRLDRVIAILHLAHRDAIERAKREVRNDPVNAQILEVTADDWVKSGEVQRRVAASARTSTRTIRSRLQELLSQQAIEQRGGGANVEYRSTGLL
jgi:transcription initiation factor TFIIIB Brf1 subunit/transcription initiation factor TFIIB